MTISQATYDLVAPYFQIEPLGEREIKGLERIACYQVAGRKRLIDDTRRIARDCAFVTVGAALGERIAAFQADELAMVDFSSIQSRDGALNHNEAVATMALALRGRLAEADDATGDAAAALDEAALLRVALLHDVGKHAIDATRLNDAALTSEARDALRADLRDETLAALATLELGELAPAIERVYRFEADGGADAGDVDLATEIICAADIYDALTAPKLYKGTPWRIAGALEELLRLPYCAAETRPVFAAFIELMKPADAPLSVRARDKVVLR